MSQESIIYYTLTDEAPALATRSFLPIVRAFSQKANINIETKDISLAGRILALFPELLSADQQVADALSQMGEMVKLSQTNIIKLPNISASIPQLKSAIAELQSQGFAIPDYPEVPQSEKETDYKLRYDKVKGSAVNPVLREGNSDRRAPGAVKAFAKKNPHSMGEWSAQSKSHVATMTKGDFYGSEKSLILNQDDCAKIELVKTDGDVITLKESLPLLKGEVIDGAVMSKKALCQFYAEQIELAKAEGILFSLHLKATMMKVSDPIIFGYGLTVFFASLFDKYGDLLSRAGVDPSNGLGDLLIKIRSLTQDEQKKISSEIEACIENGPALAMVDSDKGITNFHVPSDIIIDASMPAAIRTSGKMWNAQGKAQDMKAIIPDRSYAGVYQASIDYCKKNGAFDPTTMGSVSNVGLMAQKAEEYGSHDKTFQISAAGVVKVTNKQGDLVMSHAVEEGDIYRMCQVKDTPIQDWVNLAVTRARLSKQTAIFWLDENRSHDRALIEKVNTYLGEQDTSGLDIRILSPIEATNFSMEKISQGEDLISVTGNVLRDYLTDLFPILELGTSAKMLSIVPLMAGGGLFETGAGGSAPKHVQQFLKENHLRWDSLGEFLALAVSYEQEALKNGNKRAGILSKTLDLATEAFLENGKGPSRKVGEIDNRGSHFYLAKYWASALAEQSEDGELKATFADLAAAFEEKEEVILDELNRVQAQAIDMGGYYHPNEEKVTTAMCPSETFNSILSQL